MFVSSTQTQFFRGPLNPYCKWCPISYTIKMTTHCVINSKYSMYMMKIPRIQWSILILNIFNTFIYTDLNRKKFRYRIWKFETKTKKNNYNSIDFCLKLQTFSWFSPFSLRVFLEKAFHNVKLCISKSSDS